MRHAALAIAAALAAALIVPAAAGTQEAGGKRVRAGGIVMDWPVSAAFQAVEPGRRLTVRVRRNRTGKRVTVKLIRLDGRNRTVALKRMRTGTFRARVARRAGASYMLRARWGGHVYEAGLSVAPNAGRCPDTGSGRAQLRLGVSSARAGERVPATLANTGQKCVLSGLKLNWERRHPEGGWVPVDPPGPTTQELYTIHPGETRRFTGVVWSTLKPGEHRATVDVFAAEGNSITLPASRPFQVVP